MLTTKMIEILKFCSEVSRKLRNRQVYSFVVKFSNGFILIDFCRMEHVLFTFYVYDGTTEEVCDSELEHFRKSISDYTGIDL